MSEKTASQIQSEQALHVQQTLAIKDLLDQRDALRAKLDASERAAAPIRDILQWIADQENLFFAECSQAEEIIVRARNALSSDAGRDYVPKTDLEEAQRVLRYCEEKLMRKGDHSLPEAVDRWVGHYVPKMETDAAWAKGMTDAAEIAKAVGWRNERLVERILAARDASKEGAAQAVT